MINVQEAPNHCHVEVSVLVLIFIGISKKKFNNIKLL